MLVELAYVIPAVGSRRGRLLGWKTASIIAFPVIRRRFGSADQIAVPE
jgi:hypothetical protein